LLLHISIFSSFLHMDDLLIFLNAVSLKAPIVAGDRVAMG
jgi:hypothetical protein